MATPRAFKPKGAPVVGAALSHFKIASESRSSWDGSPSAWAPGVAGTLTSLPQGFVQRVALYTPTATVTATSTVTVTAPSSTGSGGGGPSSPGLTAATVRWGKMMQEVHNTTRVPDLTMAKLEYQTDNGAQYCYCTEDCDQKILATKAELDAEGVSIGSVSFQGGWWTNPELHTSACAPWCVTTWEPNKTKVPMGGPAFYKKLGVPLQLYAPYFCMDTPYAKVRTSRTRRTPGGNTLNLYSWVSPKNLLENTAGAPTPSLFSRGGILLPSIHADVRSSDDVIAC